MIVRRDIVTHAGARDQFVAGVLKLKAEFDTDAKLSTYDSFVLWHYEAMGAEHPGRNFAHHGPVFLPWHRYMLLVFERHMRRVLGDDSFAVPYWNWCADSELPPQAQRSATVWTPEFIGSLTSVVEDGPFAFRDGDGFVIRVAASGTSLNHDLRRGLARGVGGAVAALPKRTDIRRALKQARYDVAPWTAPTDSFRSYLEEGPPGNVGNGNHNQVHSWVGGDMEMMTSPNDPVFFLHHANIDRIWTAWQTCHGFQTYSPDCSAPVELKGHRLCDHLVSMTDQGQGPQIAQVLDVRALYEYDTLSDLLQ